MLRTITYPTSDQGEEGLQEAGGAGGEDEADGYEAKLLKYIPAETIAFFIPAYALVEAESVGARLLVLVAGCLGTWVYLSVQARRDAKKVRAQGGKPERPRWYYYVLALAAFVLWAIGTTNVDNLIDTWVQGGVPGWFDRLAIPLGVFLVPGLDELLTGKK